MDTVLDDKRVENSKKGRSDDHDYQVHQKN